MFRLHFVGHGLILKLLRVENRVAVLVVFNCKSFIARKRIAYFGLYSSSQLRLKSNGLLHCLFEACRL